MEKQTRYHGFLTKGKIMAVLLNAETVETKFQENNNMLTDIYTCYGGACRIINIKPLTTSTPLEAKINRIVLFRDEIFVPGIMVNADESIVALAVLLDGVRSVYADNMLWVPADWVEEILPQTGETIALIRCYAEKVKERMNI
jgi:hypothetical protein